MATIVVAIVAMGCATPEAPTTGVEATSMVQTIGDVSVARDGDDSVVTLAGLIDPIYSVTAPSDENLVVIDLVGVGKPDEGDLEGAVRDEDQQVAAYDGVVDLVTLSTYDEDGGTPLTRVEIVMASAGITDVVSTDAGLTIRVTPGPAPFGTAEAEQDWDEDPTDATPWQSEEMAADDAEVAFGTEPEAAPIVAAPPAATTLTGVSAQATDGGVLVGLTADGGIGALEAFTLENPARLVVDLPGIAAASSATSISVESDLVTGVRLGAHAEKVRIVIDGGPAAGDFSGRQIMPGTTGLWIAVGGGEALAQAMTDALDGSEAAWIASATAAATPMAEEPIEDAPAFADEAPMEIAAEETTPVVAKEAAFMAPAEDFAAESDPVEIVAVEETALEMAPAADEAALATLSLAEVYGLHYERTEGLDRTAILADDTLAYTTSAPDASTWVVSIPGARISDEASDRIFPKQGGPVSMIHAFQQPEVETPEVRVVFTRAPNQEPVISRRGSMLFVEFQDMGIAAAAPPAFPNAGGEQEATGLTLSESPVEPIAGTTSAEAPVAAVTPMADPYAMDAPAPSPTDLTSEPTPIQAIATPAAPIEVAQAAAAPGFESGGAMEAMPVADPNAMWDAPQAAPAAPAAVEVPAAIEVLEEGGLIDGKEYRGRRVSLDFKDVAIADVLRLIAEVSDLNIIAGDEVSGNVTIRLVDVPWDQALDVILMTKGLGFVRVGNVLRIAPSDVLKAEEEVRLQERRNKEKLEDLEVKLLPVNYASVKDTEGLVKRLLSARGTVNLDERTNTLIIKDIASVIDEASALISAIDTQTPQVMIEAKIVEASLDFSRELGSVWGIQTQRFTDPFDPDTPRRDLDFANDGINLIDENSLAFANPIAAVPTGLLTVGALILDQDFRVDAQIQAAESTGDGKVVSSPRIVTLDNTEARIEQGVSIPFQTFEGGDAKLEFIDAVLSLIVTPHITADESIIMEIQVSRNAPDDSVQTPTGSPAIARNEAMTETLVKDGQTLVLGGIYTITKSNTQSRIPYLHRIPVIGNAFKSNSVRDSRQELLVFVTPRIVRLPEMASN
ncbi:MAG: type IV pilus secretin PilQ [bacterium]|nr:type IV pilus secretin PilQ [bacterium]